MITLGLGAGGVVVGAVVGGGALVGAAVVGTAVVGDAVVAAGVGLLELAPVEDFPSLLLTAPMTAPPQQRAMTRAIPPTAHARTWDLVPGVAGTGAPSSMPPAGVVDVGSAVGWTGGCDGSAGSPAGIGVVGSVTAGLLCEQVAV
ncbi:hypothetical protein ACFY3B_07410 [Micromonospora parva]|uniref:Uncharacterized protein n=1 Tax=Micromonospora parva TaxID=1464048 RepID=A0ABW6VS86_9ACTN